MRVIDLPVSTSRPSCCKIDGSHLAASEEIEVIAIAMIRRRVPRLPACRPFEVANGNDISEQAGTN